MKKNLAFILVLSTIWMLSAHAQNGWEQMTSMPQKTADAASCIMDSSIFVIGGWRNTVEAYNIDTDNWVGHAPLPVDLSYTPAGIVENKIYVVGGWRKATPAWFTTDSTFVYDPELDSWDIRTKCPKKIGYNSLCVWEDKLYLFGGLKDWPDEDPSGQNEVLVYDPAADSWDYLAEMSQNRGSGSTAVVLDDKMYVMGGIASLSDLIGTPERYDPVENTWLELSEMPVPVEHHKSLVYNGKIYLFGGVNFAYELSYGRCIDVIQEYDPVSDTWTLMKNMPFTRASMVVEKAGSYAYFMGGYPENTRDSNSKLDEVWRFNLDSLKAAIPLTGISLDKDSLELNLLDTARLVATVIPADATYSSVSWSSRTSLIATVKDGFVKGFRPGKTYIYVSTEFGNFKDSCLVTVTTVDGINNAEATEFNIFPNPASDLITIEFGSHGNYTVEITVLNGQLIRREEMEGSTHQIDLSTFQKGVYFITIRSIDFVSTRKIIKLSRSY